LMLEVDKAIIYYVVGYKRWPCRLVSGFMSGYTQDAVYLPAVFLTRLIRRR